MTGILDQLGIDPFYIFLILFIMQVVLIVLLVVLYDIYKRLEKSYTVFMKGKNGKDLETSIFRKFSKLDKIAELVKENERHVKKLSKQAKSQYQKSGIVRYDALHEMNGNMSFVLTMLDGENSGWIFNAMHSREGCYTYIKEVIHESDHSIQNGLIGRFHFGIKCRYYLFIIKRQVCAVRYFAGFVVVRCDFQILLAGICVIRIDYLDQTHQHFWIG